MALRLFQSHISSPFKQSQSSLIVFLKNQAFIFERPSSLTEFIQAKERGGADRGCPLILLNKK